MATENEHRTILRIGDAMRLDRTRRSRRQRRVFAVAALIGALGVTIALPSRPLLVWNASASAPIGLYGITAPHDIVAGDMVIARVPVAWRSLAAARRYIPAQAPLVKRVAAAPGDTVCAIGSDIIVNGQWRARRRRADGRGHPMPWWHGCKTLQDGAVLLLTASPASFDGRYFGPSKRSDIIGRAHLLWAR
jgi:conjugative transfer signal peptidase TraF